MVLGTAPTVIKRRRMQLSSRVLFGPTSIRGVLRSWSCIYGVWVPLDSWRNASSMGPSGGASMTIYDQATCYWHRTTCRATKSTCSAFLVVLLPHAASADSLHPVACSNGRSLGMLQ